MLEVAVDHLECGKKPLPGLAVERADRLAQAPYRLVRSSRSVDQGRSAALDLGQFVLGAQVDAAEPLAFGLEPLEPALDILRHRAACLRSSARRADAGRLLRSVQPVDDLAHDIGEALARRLQPGLGAGRGNSRADDSPSSAARACRSASACATSPAASLSAAAAVDCPRRSPRREARRRSTRNVSACASSSALCSADVVSIRRVSSCVRSARRGRPLTPGGRRSPAIASRRRLRSSRLAPLRLHDAPALREAAARRSPSSARAASSALSSISAPGRGRRYPDSRSRRAPAHRRCSGRAGRSPRSGPSGAPADASRRPCARPGPAAPGFDRGCAWPRGPASQRLRLGLPQPWCARSPGRARRGPASAASRGPAPRRSRSPSRFARRAGVRRARAHRRRLAKPSQRQMSPSRTDQPLARQQPRPQRRRHRPGDDADLAQPPGERRRPRTCLASGSTPSGRAGSLSPAPLSDQCAGAAGSASEASRSSPSAAPSARLVALGRRDRGRAPPASVPPADAGRAASARCGLPFRGAAPCDRPPRPVRASRASVLARGGQGDCAAAPTAASALCRAACGCREGGAQAVELSPACRPRRAPPARVAAFALAAWRASRSLASRSARSSAAAPGCQRRTARAWTAACSDSACRQRLLGLGKLGRREPGWHRLRLGLQPQGLILRSQPRQAVARILAEAVLPGEIALPRRGAANSSVRCGAPLLRLDLVGGHASADERGGRRRPRPRAAAASHAPRSPAAARLRPARRSCRRPHGHGGFEGALCLRLPAASGS
jgi:hypothetical protein